MSGRLGGLAWPLVALTLTLALADCGGSSSHTSSPSAAASQSSATTASSTASTTTATTSHHAPAKHHKPPTSSSTTSTTTSTTTSGTTQNAPTPTPTGTPSAPPGLAQTTGYGTYELCAGTCTGAVPSSLRRSLHIGSCGAGQSPLVHPNTTTLRLQKFLGSSWLGAQVNWTAAASYSGPVLIRGHRAGGSGAVGFGEGHKPYDELQLLNSGQQAPPHPAGTRAWLTLVRVKTAGCYGFQIDTTRGSSTVYLKATG